MEEVLIKISTTPYPAIQPASSPVTRVRRNYQANGTGQVIDLIPQPNIEGVDTSPITITDPMANLRDSGTQ
jgi:hypothetical protein